MLDERRRGGRARCRRCCGWRPPKRKRDHQAAASLWEEAAQAGDCRALRELAVHHEHRSRDLAQALVAVDRALDRLNDWEDRHAATDFRRRRERIQAKLEREQAGR